MKTDFYGQRRGASEGSQRVFIAKVSLVGGALAWGLDPRCPGQPGWFCIVDLNLYGYFWRTAFAQRFGFANMKSMHI